MPYYHGFGTETIVAQNSYISSLWYYIMNIFSQRMVESVAHCSLTLSYCHRSYWPILNCFPLGYNTTFIVAVLSIKIIIYFLGKNVVFSKRLRHELIYMTSPRFCLHHRSSPTFALKYCFGLNCLSKSIEISKF